MLIFEKDYNSDKKIENGFGRGKSFFGNSFESGCQSSKGKEKNIQKIQATARFDGLNKPILIETGTKGGAASELFRLWDEDYLTDYTCIQSEPIGTKADRATALRHAIYDGYIHIYCPDQAMRKELKTQLDSFPNGSAHKDLIDAMAHAFNYLKDKDAGGHIKTGSKRQRRRLS